MSDLLADFAAAANLTMSDRDVVVVNGRDALSFLQSLVSQDLEPLVPGAAAHSLLLQPQGKLVAEFRIVMVSPTEFWCHTEAGVGALLVAGLNRFKIRVEVEIAIDTALVVAMLRGTASISSVEAAALHDVVVARSDWGALPGIDVVGPRSAVDVAVASLLANGAELADEELWESARVYWGVVRQGRDIDETTIAQEAELERDAVSFTKGCFLGQELVCRIDTRGHVNRFVRRLEFDDGLAPVVPGTAIRTASDDGRDREVGVVTSAAPRAPWALATVRREVEPGEQVVAAGRVATVHSLAAS